MDRSLWQHSYPAGIAGDVNLDEFSSVKQIVEKSCQKFSTLPAFSSFGHALSYSDLDRMSTAFGAFLQQWLGLTKGARIAIMLPNLLQYPVVLFGVLRAGLTAVNVNPLYTARELEHQLKDSGATAIIVLENFAHTLQQVLPRTKVQSVITTQVGDMLPAPKRLALNLAVKYVKRLVPAWEIKGALPYRRCLQEGQELTLKDVDVGHDDIAFLQYTGGTTGVAKGAMLTHRNMVANLQQATAWMDTKLTEGKETVITPLPMYHIFSLVANCLVFMKYGGHNILIANPRDLPGFVAELRRQPFTAITGVNTLFNSLINTPGFSTLDFSRLRVSVGAGAAVQRAVATRWKEVTGCAIVEAYGLTECAPAVCVNPLSISEFTGTVGLPLPSTEISIRDNDGNELALGMEGEVCVRGPQVMKGYWQSPEATDEVLSQDGWLRTGDIGVMDEHGYLRIADRKKDMILVSGFNVYPNEIEDVVSMLPGVLEDAVIGVPDEVTGEAVKLFVVKRDPSLTVETLIAHCRANLVGYKVPKQIEFRSELPKTPIGKVLRRGLRGT